MGSMYCQLIQQQRVLGLLLEEAGLRKVPVIPSKLKNGFDQVHLTDLQSILENHAQSHLTWITQLREWITLENVPFQSTRAGDSLRGHYIFATPEGSNYGNSKGLLKGAWGDVRGKNGIIVVSPTPHSKQAEGGQYVWRRTGLVPLLPYALQKLLPEANHQSVQSIEIAEADTFFANHVENACEELLEVRLVNGKSKFLCGSRHDACRDLLLACMKDARAGLYSAKSAVEAIATLFVSVKPQDEWSSPREFVDMTLWTIAQALQFSDEEIALHRESQLTINSPQVQDWIKRHDD
jgi:hypothetical protein